MPTDSDRILASGAPITLVDGRVVHLRYTLRALKQVQDHFGTLTKANEALNTQDHLLEGLTGWLAAGLMHEGLDEESVIDKVDAGLPEMALAIRIALGQALPEPPEASVTDPKDDDETRSIGPGGTSSEPSPSDEATISSGE